MSSVWCCVRVCFCSWNLVLVWGCLRLNVGVVMVGCSSGCVWCFVMIWRLCLVVML